MQGRIKTKMPTIKESAKAYEPKKTKNIADLEVVRTDIDIKEETFNTGKEDEFTINTIVINDETYRVPDSVLKSLKAILQEKPELKTFKVVKSGEGFNTTYTVVSLE